MPGITTVRGLVRSISASRGSPLGHDDETRAATREGTVIGTTAYMSPEQTRGQAVDKRSDIWAFGCVLYEMLAGRSAFGKATTTDTLAAIVEREPDWTAIPPQTPEHVVRLVKRSLVKDPRERLRDIGDARIELSQTAVHTATAPVTAGRGASSRNVGVAVITLAAVAAAAAYYGRFAAPSAPAAELRFAINPPQGEEFSMQVSAVFFALSPDGSKLAFVANDATGPNGPAISVQPVNDVKPQRIVGTEGAYGVFWSPGGDEIAFFVDNHLKKVNVRTGIVATICDVPDAARQHGSWGSAGTIVFAAGEGGLQAMPYGPVLKIGPYAESQHVR